VSGIVAGFNIRPLGKWLARNKRLLIAAVIVLAPLAALETEVMFRLTDRDWRGGVFTLTGSLYAVAFVLVFLSNVDIPGKVGKSLQDVGKASFGIYLMHSIVLEFVARASQKYIPWLLRYSVLFQVVMVAATVGGLWLFLTLVSRSPVRKYYRYVFG
jgi:peptidoglycan/LPS O-acetylase OafA/YrhL